MDSIERFAKLYACVVTLGGNVADELRRLESAPENIGRPADYVSTYTQFSISLSTLFSLAHCALDAYDTRHETEIARIKRDKTYMPSTRRAIIAATNKATAEPFHLSDFAPKF